MSAAFHPESAWSTSTSRLVLSLTKGAALSAASLGKGDPGSVTINASGSVSFDGVINGFTTRAPTAIHRHIYNLLFNAT